MAKFKECPNCGNTENANIYRCNKCGRVFCSACGKASTSMLNWITAKGHSRCPFCNSNETTQIGSIGVSLW
jgi:DNA-directed RNA polymerase subunit RPC12/RpoP